MIYPWQQSAWQRLYQAYTEQRLPHALLLSGAQGVGKWDLARHLAEFLLCDQPIEVDRSADSARACGECSSCQWLAAGTHPDILLIQPEEEGKVIPIDAIRGVAEFLALKSQHAQFQVVIISPAEAMNRFAANSLLKTLEEPTSGSIIMMLSHQPGRLLPTIRSRCQQLHISCPLPAQSAPWLQTALQANATLVENRDLERLLGLCGGAPLRALQFSLQGKLTEHDNLLKNLVKIIAGEKHPLAESDAWLSVGKQNALNWLYLWTGRLIALKSHNRRDDSVFGADQAVVEHIVQNISLQRLFAVLDKIVDALRIAHSQVNDQLMIEDLLVECGRLRSA